MAKSITIKEDSLRVIKESMVGSSNTASHNTVCVNEARPEVDEFELGQESDNPPVGGNYCHVNEGKVPKAFIDNAIKLMPSKFHNWVVIDLIDISRMPRYFQKRQTAYEYYKWLKIRNDYEKRKGNVALYKPVMINLNNEMKPINEVYSNISVRGDMDKVDYIDYVPHDNAREEGYTVDNITEFTPYYELMCYGVNGDIIFSGELTLNELFDYFPDRIIHMMSNKEGRKVSEAEYRIEDILSWDCKPNNIDDVEEVNAIAKRIQPGGPSAYLLVDGDVVSFLDHIQITSIEGMSPSKFVGLGNIRVGVGGNGIELSKMPTQDQLYALKTILRGQNETYLDIVKDDGRMYPTCICSAAYKNANPNRVINDIIYYFEDGIRPQGTMAYESKRKYRNLVENKYFNEGIRPQGNVQYEEKDKNGSAILEDKRTDQARLMPKNVINEYSSDLRLPFEELEYANKFYIEQYKDWLEDYGKYGKLPNGTLNFWDEIGKAVTKIKDEELHGRFDKSIPQDMSVDEVINDLKTRLIGPYIKFTNDGKVYVERAISTDKQSKGYDGNQRTDFYKRLWQDYNDNVGGCWSYCENGSQAYCGKGRGDGIILRGYIRTDDIDFIKTVQLNYHYSDEHEIRVKPFAKVELFNFSYGNDTINFDKDLIVSSTYSGNNSKFVGNVGKIDDGFGNITYINRQNKTVTEDEFNSSLNKYFEKLGSIDAIEDDANVYDVEEIDDEIYLIELENGKCNIYNNTYGFIASDVWFDTIVGLKNNIAVIVKNNLYNYVDYVKGFTLSSDWFRFALKFDNGFGKVMRDDKKCNFINSNGEIISKIWFDNVGGFFDGIAFAFLDGNKYKLDTNGNLTLAESRNGNKNILVSENQLKTIKENLDFEVSSSEIDLSSFKKKHELVPNIWKPNGELNSRVRLKLLDIADDFWKFVNLTWVKPRGIILTGSICNYNWSQYSDIDLHLIVDFDEIDEKAEFVRDYLDAKKNEWNNEHSGLQIMGYPVELYVQNLGEMPESNGIYDLEENDWVREPNPDDIKSIGLNKFSIKDKAANIMTIIDDMYDALNSTSDSHDIEQIGDDAKYLWKKVKDMRKKSLATSGENGSGNIVYKILRRTNYLEKLWKLSTIVYDRSNSITESTNVENIDIFSLAKERFGTTNDIRECGYVLPDGSMLDFSGRHMVTGDTDTSHLKGRRSVDHREIGDLNWDRDMTTRNNLNINMADFIRKGAIRIHCSNTWSSINLFVKPTKEQINPLLRLIQYSKGNVTVEVGDGDNSYEYAEWDEANPRRVINDVIRYFDGVTIKLVGNVTESKEIIKEYLEKDNNLPLYKYFKWVQTASENDKLKDLMYDAPYALEQYIKNMSKQYPQFEELRMELIKNEDIVYDEDFVEKASEIVVSLGLYNAYECFFRNVIDYYEWPSWLEMDFIRIVKNEWCIHFTEYADDISKEGFTSGTEDISRLAFTGAGQQKSSAGYDFAFLIDDRNVDFNNYGTKAVIFRTSGVLVRHYGDEQDQVIFWGPNVKSFIPVENDGDWIVYGQKGQVLFRGEKPSDVAFWATNNLPQYRKQIMTGKNGYIPKQAIYDPKTYKVTHKPYPIYRNESIQRCLTLLKEETVADGSSTSNPYKKRWKAEREALKNFVANYGKLMQSKEDDKGGKLYKVFFDKTMSNLIGYNYCICVQWDEVQMKPKSTVYIRALDKFTPFIRRNVQYDQRGQDNQRGTYDDLQYGNQGQNNYQYQ